MERANSSGSNMSALGGLMESVGEDREMTGAEWRTAMRLLTDAVATVAGAAAPVAQAVVVTSAAIAKVQPL